MMSVGNVSALEEEVCTSLTAESFSVCHTVSYLSGSGTCCQARERRSVMKSHQNKVWLIGSSITKHLRLAAALVYSNHPEILQTSDIHPPYVHRDQL